MTTTFERRQRIMTLLREQNTVRVTELADQFGVSEGTIRNDLTALEDAQQLQRVRGGAVTMTGGSQLQGYDPDWAARARVNAVAKQQLARAAMDWIDDGDAVLLDSSTTVFHMVPLLIERKNLTVITNSLEIGRLLAKSTDHTVILIGGMLHSDGTSVVGALGERLLEDLNIRTAFVSCYGFSLEAGLTEIEIPHAEVKSYMLERAERVIALVDASKFGRNGILPFARIDEITHLYTNTQLPEGHLSKLEASKLPVTLCGEKQPAPVRKVRNGTSAHRIGFANLSDSMPFAMDVRRGLETAAADADGVELILMDNKLDAELALAVAREMVAKGIDLAIEYQVDERIGTQLMSIFSQAGVPVIAVDIPIVGANYVGADNYRAGYMAGAALGDWVKQHWAGDLDALVMIEDPRVGALPASRLQAQVDGLEAIVGALRDDQILSLNGRNMALGAEHEMSALLRQMPDAERLAVVALNDDMSYGALLAARRQEREHDVVVVGQGADRLARREIRNPDSRYIGSTAFMPEHYGEKLIEMALRLLRGDVVPPAVYIEHTFIDQHNIALYYPDAELARI